LLAVSVVLTGCSKLTDVPPKTIEPARAALSPRPATAPAGQVLPLDGRPEAAITDAATGSLVVFTPGAGPAAATLTLLGRSGRARTVTLPGPASAVTGDGGGTVYASTRGGFFTVTIDDGTATQTAISGQADTDFTAIARRTRT
jgi:hypothetical protein